MKYLRMRVLFTLSCILIISSCSKSTIEDIGEIIADDLNNGPLGTDIIEQDEDLENQENEEEVEVEDSEMETYGSLTAKINGEEFRNWAQDDNAFFGSSLLDPKDFEPKAQVQFFNIPEIADSEELYNITIYAYDFDEGISKAKIIFLFLAGKNFESLAAGHTYESIIDTQYEGASAGYAVDVNTNDETEGDSTDEIEEIYVKITSINHDKKLISGEFNFKGKNTDTGTFYVITNGVFTDLPMTVPKKLETSSK